MKKSKNNILKIDNISTDSDVHWIWISGEEDFDEPHKFVKLVKEYATQLSGQVKVFSKNAQWVVTNDPLKLIFQCDDLFGITVIVPRKTDINLAKKTLQDLCDKLNN